MAERRGADRGDLQVPEGDVDLAAPPGTPEHDRAQEAVMYEGATAASTETPEPTGTSPDADAAARRDPGGGDEQAHHADADADADGGLGADGG